MTLKDVMQWTLLVSVKRCLSWLVRHVTACLIPFAPLLARQFTPARTDQWTTSTDVSEYASLLTGLKCGVEGALAACQGNIDGFLDAVKGQ